MHASAAITSASTELPLSVLAAPCAATFPPTSWNGAPGFPLPPSPALLAPAVVVAAAAAAALEELSVSCGACGLTLLAGLVTTGAGREGGAVGAPHMETLVTPSRVAVGPGMSLVSQLVVGAGGSGGGAAIEGVVGCACGVDVEVGVMETCTLGLLVGIVAISGMLMGGGASVGFGGGQMASTMPPWRIAPSSELGNAGA